MRANALRRAASAGGGEPLMDGRDASVLVPSYVIVPSSRVQHASLAFLDRSSLGD
jgi:hypothetical protein